MYTNIKLSREISQKKCVFRHALKVAKQADVLMLLAHNATVVTTSKTNWIINCVVHKCKA